MGRFISARLYILFFCFQFAGAAYADSSGLVASGGSVASASSKTYQATIKPGQDYSNLPSCPSTPSSCPTNICLSPQLDPNYPAEPASCNPSSCPAVCTVVRTPEKPTVVGVVNGVSYIDPSTVVTLPSCPPGYAMVNTFDSQMEISYAKAGAKPAAIYPADVNTYNAYNSIKVAGGGNLFACGGSGSTYHAGRMNTCGNSGDYPNGSIWSAGQLGNNGGTVNTAAAIITAQISTPTCGCAGSCNNTCSCSIADTPRFWNYDYQYLSCQENVGSKAYVFITGNFVPVGLVCGYQVLGK